MSCLNKYDTQSSRIYTVDDVFPALDAHETSGTHNKGVLQPCAGWLRVRCYMENTRNEVRLYDGSGQIAGALPAQPGAKQINLIPQRKGGSQ